MSKQVEQFIELTKEQVQQLQRKKKQARLIKPIIQDDRNKTKPNFVNKDQTSQHNKINNTNINHSQAESNKGNQFVEPKQKYQQKKQTRRQEYKQKIQSSDNDTKGKTNRNQSVQETAKTKPAINLQSQQFKEEDYIIKQHQEKGSQVINQINIISKSNLTEIHSQLKSKLKQFDFLRIKGTGPNIIKALQVAENVSRDFPQLKRINIPSTTIVKTTYTPKYKNQRLRQFTQNITKATITIQLSLNKLDSRHMGYQQVKINQRNDQKYSNETRQRNDVDRKRLN